jgi:hypothetical protein
VFELDHDDPQQVQGLLAASGSVDGHHRFGRHLHLYLKEPDVQRPAVEALLRGHGVAPRSFRPIEPSLEDVFLSLMSQ